MKNFVFHISILTLALLEANSQLIILGKTVTEWLIICQHSDIRSSQDPREQIISSDQSCQRVNCVKDGDNYGVEFQQCQLDLGNRVCTSKFSSFPGCCKEELCMEPGDNLTKTITSKTAPGKDPDYESVLETVSGAKSVATDEASPMKSPSSTSKSMDVQQQPENTPETELDFLTPPPDNQQTEATVKTLSTPKNPDLGIDDDQDLTQTSNSSTSQLDLPVNPTQPIGNAQTATTIEEQNKSSPPPPDSNKSEEQPSSELDSHLESEETLTTTGKPSPKPSNDLKNPKPKMQKRWDSIEVMPQSDDDSSLRFHHNVPKRKPQTKPLATHRAKDFSYTDSSEDFRNSLIENVEFKRRNSNEKPIMITEHRRLQPLKHHHHPESQPEKTAIKTGANGARNIQNDVETPLNTNYANKCQVDFARCLSMFLINIEDDSSENQKHFDGGKTKHRKSFHARRQAHHKPTVTWSDLYNEKAFRTLQKDDEAYARKSYAKNNHNRFADLKDDFPELEGEIPFSQLPHKHAARNSYRRQIDLEGPEELAAAEYNFK